MGENAPAFIGPDNLALLKGAKFPSAFGGRLQITARRTVRVRPRMCARAPWACPGRSAETGRSERELAQVLVGVLAHAQEALGRVFEHDLLVGRDLEERLTLLHDG